MIITTSSSLEGRDIYQYLDIVVGDHVVDTSCFQDPTSEDPEVSGEGKVQAARRIALDEMREQASALGANAVIGVVIGHQMVGSDHRLLLVFTTGTAVRLKYAV